MKISTRGRYALRMLADIAENQANGYVALKDVAQRQNISKKYLEQIALPLSQAGMLRAVRGHFGGYKLARPAADYTLENILRAVEGSLSPISCLEGDENRCERCAGCLARPVWQGLDRAISGYLRSLTLADVIERRVGSGPA